MKSPKPQALIGLSLPLIFLVIRHQGSRGCPSIESDTNLGVFYDTTRYFEKTGMRVQKNF